MADKRLHERINRQGVRRVRQNNAQTADQARGQIHQAFGNALRPFVTNAQRGAGQIGRAVSRIGNTMRRGAEGYASDLGIRRRR